MQYKPGKNDRYMRLYSFVFLMFMFQSFGKRENSLQRKKVFITEVFSVTDEIFLKLEQI